jgi:hypothetical protein
MIEQDEEGECDQDYGEQGESDVEEVAQESYLFYERVKGTATEGEIKNAININDIKQKKLLHEKLSKFHAADKKVSPHYLYLNSSIRHQTLLRSMRITLFIRWVQPSTRMALQRVTGR